MNGVDTTKLRPLAVVLVVLVGAVALGAFTSVAFAQDGSSTTTEATTTTTTEQPTTTTTTASTTTTQPRPTSTTSPPRSTSTTRPTASSTTESTTSTTEAPPSTEASEEQGPEIVTDETLPPRDAEVSSDDGGLSTDTKLALVVGALVLVGVGIALLTYFYWRHTRPQQYMSALDALADVEQSVPRGGDVPTAEQPAVGSSTATAAGAAAGATTAVKILDDPKPAVVDEPTQITTLEDLEAPDTSKKD